MNKKMIALSTGIALSIATTLSSAQASNVAVSIETKKIGDAVHWVSEKPITLHPGDEVEITANHKLEGGFVFHGLLIPQLNVTEQVDRNIPKTVKTTVPKDLAPGEYMIGCQFHPKHVGLKYHVVANAPEKPAKAEKKAKAKN